MAVVLDGVFVAKATGHTVFMLQVVFLPLALLKEYNVKKFPLKRAFCLSISFPVNLSIGHVTSILGNSISQAGFCWLSSR
jgi:hypothetical protein